jgi:hypothetical protein
MGLSAIEQIIVEARAEVFFPSIDLGAIPWGPSGPWRRSMASP